MLTDVGHRGSHVERSVKKPSRISTTTADVRAADTRVRPRVGKVAGGHRNGTHSALGIGLVSKGRSKSACCKPWHGFLSIMACVLVAAAIRPLNLGTIIERATPKTG